MSHYLPVKSDESPQQPSVLCTTRRIFFLIIPIALAFVIVCIHLGSDYFGLHSKKSSSKDPSGPAPVNATAVSTNATVVSSNATNDLTTSLTDETATYEYLQNTLDKDNTDLYFSHEAPPIIIRNKVGKTNCILLSCSRAGYKLVNISLKANAPTKCDRVHYQVRTYTNSKRETQPHWCRVALLRQAHKLFKGYERFFYADVDVTYNEQGVLDVAASTNEYGELCISFKYEDRNTILRDSWFVISNIHSESMKRLVRLWAEGYTERKGFLDQEVFNELYRCKDVTCLSPEEARKIERRHCGSYMSAKERIRCFGVRFIMKLPGLRVARGK